tara:strand:- start:5465 stop:6601 length:1137 start_codon:yes stop_codon:yes gene_type:complete
MELFLDFIITSGISVSILIIFLLLKSQKRNELPQKLLVLFFGMLLLYFMYHYSTIHSIEILRYFTFNFNGVMPLFLGSIIFLYVKSLFEDKPNFLKKNSVHFIPSILFIVFISTPILISLERGEMLFDYLDTIAEHRHLMFLVFDIVFVLYSVFTLMYFLRYRKTLKLNFSNLSEEDLDWIKYLLTGVLLIATVHLFLAFYNSYIEIDSFERSNITIISIFTLIIYLGYHSIGQSKMLVPHFLINEVNFKKEKKENYLSNTSNEELQQIEKRLKDVLKNDRPYLDENLTLTKLASSIPISNKKLSIFINQHLNTTFYDMINTYRVASVKEKLESNNFNNITLLGIANESGFKSKTTFNRIFKKETGLLPSEYRKSHLK